jgi:hypothetical protein
MAPATGRGTSKDGREKQKKEGDEIERHWEKKNVV